MMCMNANGLKFKDKVFYAISGPNTGKTYN